jgi:hypothetical protein
MTTLVSSGLGSPYGLSVDIFGNLYIPFSNIVSGVQEWHASTQQLTLLPAPGGLATGTAIDGSGNVYILNGNVSLWNAATQQMSTLVSSGITAINGSERTSAYGIAVDGAANIYVALAPPHSILMVPNAFVGPASFTEPATAGTDSLLPVLPTTASLTGVYAPTSDSSWLTIGTIANGAVGFSFTANTSGAARVAHISILGQQIAVTQNGVPATPPLNVSVSPSSGSGTSKTFAFTVSSAAGYRNIAWIQVAVGGCYFDYIVPSDYLYLGSESGVVGTSSTIQNSACQINLATASTSGATNNLTLNLTIASLSGMTGPQNIYMATADLSGQFAPWQLMGTWNVN